MTWLVWRQHRVQVAIAAALIAAFAVPTWITGAHLADKLDACRAGDTCGRLFQHTNGIYTVVVLTVMVPLLIGVFWGATIVGRELEAGTATLVWTQSITRRSWLRSKLVTLFVFTTVVSGADTALVTWWSGPHNSVVESRFDPLQFDIQGIGPIGFALFASAVGLAAGVLWRRTLPAMATTVGAFVGVRLVVELAVRQHYMSPITRITAFNKGPAFDVASGSRVISTDLLLHGHVVQGELPGHPCERTLTPEAMGTCMRRLGYQLRTVYQPASRYWAFQWIEFGIFAGLATLSLVVAIVVLRRQDA
jgi:hypothetical protein